MTQVEKLQAEIKELEVQNAKRNTVIVVSTLVGATTGFLATSKSSTGMKIAATIGAGLVIGGAIFFVTKKKTENRNAQIATKKDAIAAIQNGFTDMKNPMPKPAPGPKPAPVSPEPKAFPTDQGIKPELNVDVNKNGIPDYLEPAMNTKSNMSGHPAMG